MRLLFTAFVLIFSAIWLNAQTVQIKRVELAGDKIIVHYDLDDANPNVEYLINLHSSHDNYNAPLQKVSGDVGAEIKPGFGKRITWNVTEEIGAYKGRLSLEIRGRVFVPFAKLNFDTNGKYKKGKTMQLSWRSGNPSGRLHIELFNGNQRITGENNIPNNGSASLFIPASAKPSKDYRLRFTNAGSPDEVIYTPTFKVSPKTPMPLKALGILAVIGAGVFAASAAGGDGGGNGGGGTTTNDLPTPPAFPGG
ncbi:MAG TPA: hypothetical protein PKC24_00270 [Cyclobacteriaceae bacterium]|nr:hypothetical protein [Cyclobacteriaceae bacterium]